MGRNEIYQYYVEGKDDKAIIDVLKQEFRCIETGKVEVFNIVQDKLSDTRIRTLKRGTTVVLVYDTDIENNTEILKSNIDFLKRQTAIKKVICIPQVKNLEDELLRACKVNNVKEITNSKSLKDYKADLIRCSNLGNRLNNCKFDITKFWNEIPKNGFKQFGNDSRSIIKKR
ncbi:hypothetical protein [Eubacterium sp.]|uniref:hypothetical protein n=1 Tax=Eubacterium sp. TaxID=142586 RepID=UPI0025EEC245|nr:hypothetical protein [Eubacterium sp.]MCR5629590.1 hypothetical protein [Eubacterium sp.]